MSTVEDLWLDAVLAVPAVGVQLKAPPSVLLRLREVVGPSLDQLAALSDLEIVQATNQAGSELRITGKDGFTHKVVQSESGCHATVEYAFSPVETKTVGQLPTMKYEVKTYAQLVKECLRRVEIVTSSLLKQSGVHVVRLGLAATAELAQNQLPPGLLHYKEWSERPWKKRGGTVSKLQTTILVRLSTAEEQHDQCHHALSYEYGANETEYRMLLDYQRVFTKPPTRNSADSTVFLTTATNYFQTFAFPEARTWE